MKQERNVNSGTYTSHRKSHTIAFLFLRPFFHPNSSCLVIRALGIFIFPPIVLLPKRTAFQMINPVYFCDSVACCVAFCCCCSVSLFPSRNSLLFYYFLPEWLHERKKVPVIFNRMTWCDVTSHLHTCTHTPFYSFSKKLLLKREQ